MSRKALVEVRSDTDVQSFILLGSALGNLNQTTLKLVPFEFSFSLAGGEQLDLASD